METILNLYPNGFLPAVVPSKQRPGSYMRPDERFERRMDFEGIGADEYNPKYIMNQLWKDGLEVEYGKEESVSGEMMELLKDVMRTDEKTILYELAHRWALKRGAVAREKLEKHHKDSGICEAVESHVREKLKLPTKQRVTVENLKSTLKNHYSVPRKNTPEHRADLVQLVHEKTGLKEPKNNDIRDAIQRTYRLVKKAQADADSSAKAGQRSGGDFASSMLGDGEEVVAMQCISEAELKEHEALRGPRRTVTRTRGLSGARGSSCSRSLGRDSTKGKLKAGRDDPQSWLDYPELESKVCKFLTWKYMH